MAVKIPISMDGATLDAGVEEYAADGARATGLRLAQSVANLVLYAPLDEATFAPVYSAGPEVATINNAGGSALLDASNPAVGAAGSLLIDTQYDEVAIPIQGVDGGAAGCIEFFVRPAYTGTPSAVRQVILIPRNEKSNVSGEIHLDHFTNGTLRALIRNDAATQYSVAPAWSPTAGTWYHVSLNWDFDAGVKIWELFIGGVSQGTATVAGTRTAPGYASSLKIGQNDILTRRWDGGSQEMTVYSTRLRTANFTPPTAQLAPYSAAAPTATLAELDFGTAYGSWDMSTIDVFEAPDSEAGTLAYKYSASNTSGSHTYNDSWLSLTNLLLEADPTGRYFSLQVQFTSNGKQKCAIKDGTISSSQGTVPAPTFAGAATATDNTDNSVAVAWAAATFDSVTAAADRGYEIHVHTESIVDADLDADTYYLARVPSDQTSFDVFTLSDGVTALTAGTTYYFSVRAFQRLGSSRSEDQNAVNQSAAPTSGVTAPSAGINGYLGSITGTSCTAAIDAIPATNRDRWRVGYRIKNDDAANNWTYSSANTDISVGATIAISGLTADRVYEFFFQAGNGASSWGDPGEIVWIYTSNAANTWDGSEITERIMALIDDNLTDSLSLTRETQYGDLADYPPAGRDLTSHLPMCLVKLQGVSSKIVAFPSTWDLVYTYRIIYAAEYAVSDTVYKNRVDAVGKLQGVFVSFKQLGFAGGQTTQGTVGWTKPSANPDPPENNLHRHDRIYVVALTLEVYCRARA